MGFNEARGNLIDCLMDGNFSHEERKDGYRKNWLLYGRITADEVIGLLLRCRGNQYEEDRHDFDRTLAVHKFRPRSEDVEWYIKAYFDPDLDEAVVQAVFISVHPSMLSDNEDLERR